MIFHARTVVEEQGVSGFIKGNLRDWPRIEDVYEGVKWGIAREPEIGHELKNGVWIYKSYPWDAKGTPSLVVLYTFNDDEANILHINIGHVEI